MNASVPLVADNSTLTLDVLVVLFLRKQIVTIFASSENHPLGTHVVNPVSIFYPPIQRILKHVFKTLEQSRWQRLRGRKPIFRVFYYDYRFFDIL